MSSDADRALWSLEETVESVLSFVKAAAYGLRLATKRIGDLAAGGHGAGSAEMETLVEALRSADDHLSEVAVLALGDHFRAFLAAALELPQPPPCPPPPGRSRNSPARRGPWSASPSGSPSSSNSTVRRCGEAPSTARPSTPWAWRTWNWPIPGAR